MTDVNELIEQIRAHVFNKDGEHIEIADFEYICLFFSAQWCPPCNQFTSALLEFYDFVKKEKSVDIVFISVENTSDESKVHYDEMPWLHLDFKLEDLKKDLTDKLNIVSIPTVTVIDMSSRKIVCENARAFVEDDVEGTDFPWKDIEPTSTI
ncbi:hypothetical protein ACOME3_003788 [Neoechinorhynchus agilis]